MDFLDFEIFEDEDMLPDPDGEAGGRPNMSHARLVGQAIHLWVDFNDPNHEHMNQQVEEILGRVGAAEAAAHPPAPARPASAAPSHGDDNHGGNGRQVSNGTGESDDNAKPNNSAEPDDESEREYFWPHIQAYIEGSSAGPKPSLKCGICLGGLFHPSLCAPGTRHSLESMEVLNCGHVIGRRCWGRTVLSTLAQGMRPSCPFCRAQQEKWFYIFHITPGVRQHLAVRRELRSQRLVSGREERPLPSQRPGRGRPWEL